MATICEEDVDIRQKYELIGDIERQFTYVKRINEGKQGFFKKYFFINFIKYIWMFLLPAPLWMPGFLTVGVLKAAATVLLWITSIKMAATNPKIVVNALVKSCKSVYGVLKTIVNHLNEDSKEVHRETSGSVTMLRKMVWILLFSLSFMNLFYYIGNISMIYLLATLIPIAFVCSCLKWAREHTTKTRYGSDLAPLTDTVASLYTKEKVKHSVRKSIPNKAMLLWH